MPVHIGGYADLTWGKVKADIFQEWFEKNCEMGNYRSSMTEVSRSFKAFQPHLSVNGINRFLAGKGCGFAKSNGVRYIMGLGIRKPT